VNWVKLTGPSVIDRDLMYFLGSELDSEDHRHVKELQQAAHGFLDHGLQHHFLVDALGGSSFKKKLDSDRNSQLATLVFHSCCGHVTQGHSSDSLTVLPLLVIDQDTALTLTGRNSRLFGLNSKLN
jgi:hypothetical protein